jgi:hypothetical protein
MNRILCITFTGIALSGYGCAASPDAVANASAPASGQGNARTSAAVPPLATEIAATHIDARPAVIGWGELRPLLNEAAGAAMLRELILDRMLTAEIEHEGVAIGPDQLAAERRLLLETLHHDPEISIRLLEELRVRQGLGRTRFEALLRRNASLRALVRPRVEISDAAVHRMYDAVHGPRRQARLMVLPTLAEARLAAERVQQGESFVDLTVELSTDTSAGRGGLLEPIGRGDPSYPEALLNALWELGPGDVSRPIMLDGQYALLLLVREIEGDGADFDAVRPGMERRVRLALERVLMDQLARSMISGSRVTIFDDALEESWRMAGREGG